MTTPQTEEKMLAQALGIPKLYFKREDLHPYGSHKGRSIPHMIDMGVRAGAKKFAISSSGNAALAAMIHVNKLNNEGAHLALEVFIGEKIKPTKLEALNVHRGGGISISKSPRPLQALLEATKKGAKSLRQSEDDTALTGYHELARELAKTKDIEAVFIGTSSGTTIQGLAEEFKTLDKKIKLFAVQTTACHPLADEFKKSDIDEPSIADAIVDQTILRRVQVIKALKASKGKALIVTNTEIKKAQSASEKLADLHISTNSALSLAGLMQTLQGKTAFTGSVVCIITGK